jgi:hypothetical protein
MKLYLSKSHSDEDGPYADEGKLGMIISNREDLIKLCDFFEKVKDELSKQDNIHMHFRDSFEEWNRENHIDIEVNTEN